MRISLLALAALGSIVMLQAQPAAAQEASVSPWCAQMVEGNMECTFVTEKQCLETLSGNGGYCEQNPAYSEAAPPPRARRQRHG